MNIRILGKRITAIILGLALLQSAAIAAPRAKSEPVPTQSWNEASRNPEFSVSGPLSLLEGTALWGVYFNVMWDKLLPVEGLTIGGETGFQIGSSDFLGVSVTTWVIPIVPTAFYHFQIPDAPTIAPYIGLGLGIAIAHQGLGSTSPIVTVTGATSDTSVEFEGMIHLGAAFAADKRLFGDIRLGLIGGGFLFAPTIGWKF